MSRKKKIPILMLVAAIACTGCGNEVVDNTPYGPGVPSNPFPASGSVDQEITLELSWQCENGSGLGTEYDVYLGTEIGLPLIASGLDENSYVIDSLDYNTTYLWRVVARDGRSNEALGHVWNFSTRRAPGIYPVGDFILQGSGYEMLVDRNLACIAQAFDWSYEITFVDISNPENPGLAGRYADSLGIRHLFLFSHYIFALNHRDLLILDISDVANPLFVTSLEFPYPRFGIFVKDDIAFITGYEGMNIVDVSIPDDPVTIGFYEYPFRRSSVLVSGDFAYVTVWTGDLHILDVSNPTDPELVATYPTEDALHGVFVRDDIAFLDMAHGFLSLDISNRSAPILIGAYDMDGVIYFHNDLIFNRFYNTLTILDVSDASSPRELFCFESYEHFSAIRADDRYIYSLNNGAGFTILEYEP